MPVQWKVNNEIINFFSFHEVITSIDENELTSFYSTSIFDNVLEIMDSILTKPDVEKVVNEFLMLLIDSCRKRIINRKMVCKNCPNEKQCSVHHTKLGIPFSGGLDSTIIALIADIFIPKNEAIDLLNVAFKWNGTFNVPDRKTAILSLEELRNLCPERIWNLVEVGTVFCRVRDFY